MTATAGGGTYAYREPGGLTYTFDADGTLFLLEDRNGNRQVIGHDSERRVTTVEDSQDPSRRLTFLYDGAHISNVTDFTGRRWTFK
jgi:hypothetical protein